MEELTQEQRIRLESVRMAYRHDRPASEITTKADEISKYVIGKSAGAKAKAKAPNDGQVAQENDPI